MEAAKTCLLVVDVQPEFWSDCVHVSKDFPEFPAKCARALSACRAAGALVVHVRADYSEERSPWLAQFALLNPGKQVANCEAGEVKWEAFATPMAGEPLVRKASWNASTDTALVAFLRAARVEAVLVLGLITSVCVQHSAFGVFEAGFRVSLVQDACADRGRERHDAAVMLYGNYMYGLLRVADIEDAAVLQPVRAATRSSSSSASVVAPAPAAANDGTAVLSPVVLTAENLQALADARAAQIATFPGIICTQAVPTGSGFPYVL